MAFGNLVGARKYVNKVFDVEAALGGLTDGRTSPTVPFASVMVTWFWSLTRRSPSTEQVGDLLRNARWQKQIGLKPGDGGSADTAARVLDELNIEELNEVHLDAFFAARRAGILKDDGPYGKRLAIVDLNELFKSEKIHCDKCQVREKKVKDAQDNEQIVNEYYHQAVALVWGGELTWPIGWELLAPGEGELTAALRLLARLLPRLAHSLDGVMGDALYCCRPFFKMVCAQGLDAYAISSGVTEMDSEIELLMKTEAPVKMPGPPVDAWAFESEAWQPELQRKLRIAHYVRRYPEKPWKHERQTLRLVTSAPVSILPLGQGWKVGRFRWRIENGTFNILTRDYALEHNYRHSTPAIVALLVLRSLAYCFTMAYRRFATARSKNAPRFILWFQSVFVDDWVRYLDGLHSATADPLSG